MVKTYPLSFWELSNRWIADKQMDTYPLIRFSSAALFFDHLCTSWCTGLKYKRQVVQKRLPAVFLLGLVKHAQEPACPPSSGKTGRYLAARPKAITPKPTSVRVTTTSIHEGE